MVFPHRPRYVAPRRSPERRHAVQQATDASLALQQRDADSAREQRVSLPVVPFDKLVQEVALAGGPHDTAPLIAPYTGEVLFDVPLCTVADVEQAVARARAAQASWSQLSFKERAKVFLRFHDLVLSHQESILDIIQLETGKARRHAIEEVWDTAIIARHYAHHAERELRPKRRRGALPLFTAAWECHHPLGVISFIAPWNYPLTLAITDAIPALLAGNAVVLKPDQQTPFCALWAVDKLREAGLPKDLFAVVTGRGRELGAPLISGSDYVCFTGSTPTGKVIAKQAAERLIGCSLELGGKNPMLVLEDADIDAAIEGAVRACFSNSGQLCISIERLYVHENIYDAFVPRLAERVRQMKLGADFDLDTEMGSLASQAQLDKMRAHVDDAIGKGAKALAGGKARPDLGPFFFEPTLLADVDETMHAAREETFGPLVSIYRFRDIDEAVAKANDTPYGLNAVVYTRNAARGRAVAERIAAGTVSVNDSYAATWGSIDSPMGGFKESGMGRRHGRAGLLKYTETQTVAVQRLLPIAPIVGMAMERYTKVMSLLLWLIKRIPGLR